VFSLVGFCLVVKGVLKSNSREAIGKAKILLFWATLLLNSQHISLDVRTNLSIPFSSYQSTAHQQ
jgi:hypothetical protein